MITKETIDMIFSAIRVEEIVGDIIDETDLEANMSS